MPRLSVPAASSLTRVLQNHPDRFNTAALCGVTGPAGRKLPQQRGALTSAGSAFTARQVNLPSEGCSHWICLARGVMASQLVRE